MYVCHLVGGQVQSWIELPTIRGFADFASIECLKIRTNSKCGKKNEIFSIWYVVVMKYYFRAKISGTEISLWNECRCLLCQLGEKEKSLRNPCGYFLLISLSTEIIHSMHGIPFIIYHMISIPPPPAPRNPNIFCFLSFSLSLSLWWHNKWILSWLSRN